MARKSKFYDIIPKESKSIRNIPISKKEDDEKYELEKDKAEKTLKKHNQIKKHNHQESSSVEIKKLERPITNVEEYNEDEYIEIVDHKIADDEVTEEIHLLGTDKKEIDKTKIPALAEDEDKDFINYTKGRSSKSNMWLFSGSYRFPVFVVVLLVAIFFILNLFSSATITIKTADLHVALGDGFKFDQGDGETLQATSTETVSVPATGSVTINKKSTGSILMLNNSSASQKLTKGTRLQASNGLIYLLDQAVTIPAKKTVSKKVTVGSVTTTFTAEAVGDKYNGGPKDFTLPGFKGTAKFDTIYGRSKGSITGGYSGEVPNISQKDLTKQISAGQDKIKYDLLALLKQKADSQELIIDSSTLQYKIINSQAQLSSDKSLAVVTLSGSLQAQTLLNASVNDMSKQTMGVVDGNGFKYEANLGSSTLEVSSTSTDGQITVKGSAELAVAFDKVELTKSLENKGKKDALSILQQTKGVSYAQIKTFPFWNMTMPKANRITVLVQD